MKRILPLVFLLCAFDPAHGAGRQWHITADQWFAPRDGGMIVRLQPVAQSVAAWMKQPRDHLVIEYPGGEEGTLWARELQDWLVSLGVPSSKIVTSPGYARRDQVGIELRRPEELY
ncbi:MAG: hypothetical protein P8076_00580 [Gammaproteobacteria bacterium]